MLKNINMLNNVRQLFLLWVLNSKHDNDNGTDDKKRLPFIQD